MLAVIFLVAGMVKLAMPFSQLSTQMDMPGAFLRFIAVAEVLGAAGLVLPGWLHKKEGLTPLAAVGLLIIMMGATVVTFRNNGALPALFPTAVGSLCGVVAWERYKLSRSMLSRYKAGSRHSAG